ERRGGAARQLAEPPERDGAPRGLLHVGGGVEGATDDRLVERAGEHGISAVPTFVVDGRWAIPGAQDVETFERVLRRLAERR
ncbi:MAG: DsbA family oxidoreductase, partial [Ilumatobacteraceae bacterium]